jgi:hypothetical protein
MDAITNAATLTIGKFRWTIINVTDRRNDVLPFVFGHLAKFSAEGHVTVVDTNARALVDALAPNLLVASAPFVYLPDFSGIAYLHVWNGIQEELFSRRFKNVIEATYQNFFVDCSIEPLADYREFSSKLKGIERFTEVSAKVYPPNPLFGRYWDPLRKYMRERNAAEVSLAEYQEGQQGLKTDIVRFLDQILKDPNSEPPSPPALTDAALLMAADGYGLGKVTGIQGGSEIVIRTSDTQKSFLYATEPVPEDLAGEAAKRFEQVSTERNMKHDEEDH